MTISEEIYAKALSMLKEFPSQVEESRLRECCAAAEYELTDRLKEGISLESIHEQFVRGAGVLGLSMYVGMSIDPVETASAGRVSVKRRGSSGAAASARSLRRQAELMLLGFIEKNDFDFRAVRY